MRLGDKPSSRLQSTKISSFLVTCSVRIGLMFVIGTYRIREATEVGRGTRKSAARTVAFRGMNLSGAFDLSSLAKRTPRVKA